MYPIPKNKGYDTISLKSIASKKDKIYLRWVVRNCIEESLSKVKLLFKENESGYYS